MKQKLFTTNFYAALFAAGLLFTSFTVSAQVKIGTNPTVIGPNSNLEVEASTLNHKVIVDKTLGKVTIADGTEGDGKVFTSNAAGEGSWKDVSATQVNFFATFTGAKPFVSGNLNTVIDFDVASPNVGGGYDVANNRFVAPRAGIYYFIGTCYVHCELTTFQAYYDVLSIKVNNVAKITEENFQYRSGGGNAFSIPYLIRLNAGDVVQLFASSSKPNPTFVGYASTINAPQTTFQGFLIGN